LALQGVVGLRRFEMGGRIVRATVDGASGWAGVAEGESWEGRGCERLIGEGYVVEEVLWRDVWIYAVASGEAWGV
jgi:hypothetical protein